MAFIQFLPHPRFLSRQGMILVSNRSEEQNVRIDDAKDLTIELGGLILTIGVTNPNFFSMLETLFLCESR